MNAKLTGISELSADDLNGVTGGSDIRGAVVGYIVGKLLDNVNVVEQIMDKATGTLKGLTPRPPK